MELVCTLEELLPHKPLYFILREEKPKVVKAEPQRE